MKVCKVRVFSSEFSLLLLLQLCQLVDLSLDLSQLSLLLLFDLLEKNRPSRLFHRFYLQDVVVWTLPSILPTLLLSHVVHRLECSVGLLKVLRLAGVETARLYRSCVISLTWFLLWSLFCFLHSAGDCHWCWSRVITRLFAKIADAVTLILAQLFSHDSIASMRTLYLTLWPFHLIYSSMKELRVRLSKLKVLLSLRGKSWELVVIVTQPLRSSCAI